jgi:uncharacterized membrane protein
MEYLMRNFYSRLTLILIVISLVPIYFLSGQVSIQGDHKTKGSSILSTSGYSQFTWLGNNVIPNAVSPDGRVVVGQYGTRAFCWDEKTGLITLQDLSTTIPTPYSAAMGVSNDGMVIVGWSMYDTMTVGYDFYSLHHAVRWSSSGGITELPSMGFQFSRARAVDAAGINIVGEIDSSIIRHGYPDVLWTFPRASRWTGGSVSSLPGLNSIINRISYAHGISPDGSLVVGSDNTSTAASQFAVKWDGAGKSYLGFTYPPYSKAVCASANGNDVIVQLNDPNPYWSYRLTAAGGKYSLGSKTDPKAITADGRRIVGQYSVYPWYAVIWDAGSNTPQNLKLFLQNSYGINLNNCELWDAKGISADGNVIVGYGKDSLGTTQGFRVVLNDGPIRVWKPIKNSFWKAGSVDTIRWSCYKNIDSVSIYFSTDNGVTQQLIASGIPGDSGSFPWSMPDSIMSSKCKIIIKVPGDTTKGESNMFKVKGAYLTRYNATGDYERFKQSIHDYSFANDDMWLWPSGWYNQFDYKGTDPVTGQPYSADAGKPFLTARSKDFPDWPLFVKVFGKAACYEKLTPPVIYKDRAYEWWKVRKGNWSGSCWGYTASTLMAFDDKARFRSAYPEMKNFNQLNELACDDSVRYLLNMLWMHQYGVAHQIYMEPLWDSVTPTQTVSEISDMLLNDKQDNRFLGLTNNGTGGGSHVIVPFKISSDISVPGVVYINVNDSNYPNDTTATIWVDTLANGGKGTWVYSNLPSWGGAKWMFLMDPVSTYYTQPDIPKGSASNNTPFATFKPNATSPHQVYSNQRSSLVLADMLGNETGFVYNSILNDIPGAVPLTSFTGRVGAPMGYSLPAGDYTVRIDNLTDSLVSFTYFGDSTILTYDRRGALHSETDRFPLCNDHELRITNIDTTAKKVDVKIVVEEGSYDKVFRIGGLDVRQSDLISVSSEDRMILRIAHWGGVSTQFDLLLKQLSQDGENIFKHDGVVLEGNATYNVVPDWNNFAADTTLLIMIDRGNNGTVDDTLWLQNELLGVNELGSSIPSEYKLYQNYPNPFNPVTTFKYQLPGASHISLKVYNTLGQLLATLIDEIQQAGYKEVQWNASDVASGVYFYKLETTSLSQPIKNFTQIKKLLLLK